MRARQADNHHRSNGRGATDGISSHDDDPVLSLSQETTFVSYINSLREVAVEEFCSVPFNLTRKQAEKCANIVMTVIEQKPGPGTKLPPLKASKLVAS